MSISILTLVSTSLAQDKDINTKKEITQLKLFVDSGITYIKQTNKKIAYAEIGNPKGKFTHRDMYLFVFSYKGLCLAHGGDPKNMVGKNLYELQDQYGTPIVKIMIETARSGGGFLSYYWNNPLTNKIQAKTSYVKPIDKETFIGAGIYQLVDVPKSYQVKVEELKAYLKSGISYIKEHGAQAAYKEFENPNGEFIVKDMYLFVGTYDGLVLSNGGYKELTGTNLYNKKDEFGIPYNQSMCEIAKIGGGVVSYYWPNPVTKKIHFKISYAMPIDDKTWIGAGFYENL